MDDAVTLERASLEDVAAIAAVHVEGWRSAYPGILPDRVLLGLSANRIAPHYAASIRSGRTVRIARAGRLVVGFATGSVCRSRLCPGEGEIETLYVLDDWRERGIGRSLLIASARELQDRGCKSVFVHVLSDNPSRWFYRRLGAVEAAVSTTLVGGVPVRQTAMLWAPIGVLLAHGATAG